MPLLPDNVDAADFNEQAELMLRARNSEHATEVSRVFIVQCYILEQNLAPVQTPWSYTLTNPITELKYPRIVLFMSISLLGFQNGPQ